MENELKAYRPLPPIKKGETLSLDYKDVKRINDTFVEYVRKLGDFSSPAPQEQEVSDEKAAEMLRALKGAATLRTKGQQEALEALDVELDKEAWLICLCAWNNVPYDNKSIKKYANEKWGKASQDGWKRVASALSDHLAAQGMIGTEDSTVYKIYRHKFIQHVDAVMSYHADDKEFCENYQGDIQNLIEKSLFETPPKTSEE